MKKLLFIVVLLISNSLLAQKKLDVLFLGNSYTYGNNLPAMLSSLALSKGDTLIHDQHTPGGYTTWQHANNTQSLNLISTGQFDHIILQEQSYVGTVDWARVNLSYPAILFLREQVKQANNCTDLMLFMTWGRKNSFQGQITSGSGTVYYTANYIDYFHMQDSLTSFYMNIANQEKIPVSPVGEVWRKVKTDEPTMELYTNDGSHPNKNGTYLAACTFYAALFHKSPVGASVPSGITAQHASIIQQAAAQIVLPQLNQWRIDTTTVLANFDADTNSLEVTFQNNSANADGYLWDFGDGNTSTLENPVHTYDTSGNYFVTLSAIANCDSSIFTDTIMVIMADTNSNGGGNTNIHSATQSSLRIYPIPARRTITIEDIPQGYNKLTLHSSTGQLVIEREINEGYIELALGTLPNGIYSIILHGKTLETNLLRQILIKQD